MSHEKPQSAVRKSLGEFAPKLVDLTEGVLFGTSGSARGSRSEIAV